MEIPIVYLAFLSEFFDLDIDEKWKEKFGALKDTPSDDKYSKTFLLTNDKIEVWIDKEGTISILKKYREGAIHTYTKEEGELLNEILDRLREIHAVQWDTDPMNEHAAGYVSIKDTKYVEEWNQWLEMNNEDWRITEAFYQRMREEHDRRMKEIWTELYSIIADI